MTPRLLAALALACATLVLTQAPGHAACRCVQSDVRDDVKRADAVFSGVLVATSGDSKKSESTTYEIEPDMVYKGDVRTSSIDVRSTNNACTLGSLESDKRYVFFVTEEGSELRADKCGGTKAASANLVRAVEQETGEGTPLGRPDQPVEEVTVEFTKVSDAEPDSLTRIAAPGAALVLVGLLGLLVVRRVRD